MKKWLIRFPNQQTFFLFGARNTGKSTLIKQYFCDIPHLYIDLLNVNKEREYFHNPQLLKARVLGLDDHIKCGYHRRSTKNPLPIRCGALTARRN